MEPSHDGDCKTKNGRNSKKLLQVA